MIFFILIIFILLPLFCIFVAINYIFNLIDKKMQTLDPKATALQVLQNTTPTPAVMAQNHASIIGAVQTNVNTVKALGTQLAANNGIVPASWLPFINALSFLLSAVDLFAGPELKAIIEVIKAAIAAAENVQA